MRAVRFWLLQRLVLAFRSCSTITGRRAGRVGGVSGFTARGAASFSRAHRTAPFAQVRTRCATASEDAPSDSMCPATSRSRQASQQAKAGSYRDGREAVVMASIFRAPH